MTKEKKVNEPTYPEMLSGFMGFLLLIISTIALIYAMTEDLLEVGLISVYLMTISFLLFVISKILYYLRNSNYYLTKINQEQLEELNYNIRQINVKLDKIQVD
tara:strand:- start:465 stop:773 length:309 start_codon:yes stop_codon:yes gene_type:complete